LIVGKYKYVIGLNDDAQAGGALFGGVAGDREAIVLEGEDPAVERPRPVRPGQRGWAIRVTSLTEKFVPGKLSIIESPSGGT
jgi:hypothetical protein